MITVNGGKNAVNGAKASAKRVSGRLYSLNQGAVADDRPAPENVYIGQGLLIT
jgi:hypothetical protein